MQNQQRCPLFRKIQSVNSNKHVILPIFCLAVLSVPSMTYGSIACYTCSSVNGTDEFCEDPMSPAFKKLEQNCMVPKENHVGTFPANFCIKMIGTSVKTKETLVVRTCVLEDMNSQCGTFKFSNDTLKGCLLTCDFDGCNRASSGWHNSVWATIMATLGAVMMNNGKTNVYIK